MQRLRMTRTLEEDEIALLEGLYARCEVRLGKHGFRPVRGIMQGSPIAPYLFNIYTEELLQVIADKHGIDIEDILAYADDLAVICYSVNQVHEVISSIF